jgi:hypothetical protein
LPNETASLTKQTQADIGQFKLIEQTTYSKSHQTIADFNENCRLSLRLNALCKRSFAEQKATMNSIACLRPTKPVEEKLRGGAVI